MSDDTSTEDFDWLSFFRKIKHEQRFAMSQSKMYIFQLEDVNGEERRRCKLSFLQEPEHFVQTVSSSAVLLIS